MKVVLAFGFIRFIVREESFRRAMENVTPLSGGSYLGQALASADWRESAGAEATAVIRPLDVAALTTVISPFHRAFLHPHDNVHTVLSHVHGNKSAHKRDTYLPCSHAFSARRRHSLHGLDCVHTVREMDKMRVPPEGEIITLRDLTLQTSPPLARQVSSRSSRKKSSKHLQDLYD
ncbi:hypothetical protein C7M84_025021 [Penaeus vannamei]|uniref:Uncharacterized protein n=1 Tax=Penaeus vannamei TaxID=6689 RepID=A0A423TZD9_PENVA|nr:hypothetical protein C7M84_025021 [Penaeus vannamei]